MNARHIVAQSVRMSFAELPTTYTMKSWLFGWLVRLLFQVTFFALLGRLTEEQTRVEYILLGNSVAVVAMEAMFVANTAVMERFQGTLPMLIASPTNIGLVYLGRGLHWPFSGLVSSFVVFCVLSNIFSVPWGWREIGLTLPILIVIGVSAYCYACLFAAFALRHVKFRMLYPEVGSLFLIAFCGVNVPTSFWPDPLHWLAQFLPLTHGLEAIRILIDDGDVDAVVLQVGLEIGTAALWAAMTIILFERVAGSGRRDGSLSFT